MTTINVPGRRLTLLGINGEWVPLWRSGEKREGVKLKKIPSFDSLNAQPLWQQAVGQVGSSWQGQTIPAGSFTLECKVSGRNVVREVGAFLDALGDGSQVAQLVSVTTDTGHRTLDVRFNSVSDIEWFGDPADPVSASFQVMLDAPRPVWQFFTSSQGFSASEVASGSVWVRVDGTRPIWPTITVTGTYTDFSFGFDGKLQKLPYRTDGYRIVTDPEKRSITPLAGGEQIAFVGEAPYWPTPPKPTGTPAGITINTAVTSPGSNFTMGVEVTPEVTRPW